jgi:hypothetical protein
MKALQKQIDHLNWFRKLRKEDPITFPLNQEEINSVAQSLDAQASPENLHCDGEISNSEAWKRGKQLLLAFGQLKRHAEAQGMEVTVELHDLPYL